MTTTTIGAVTVSYSRPDRLWLAENGSVLGVYPAGADGQLAAIKEAIRHEDSRLHRLVEAAAAKNPELTKRWWKAARLIVNGHVLPRRPDNKVGEVARVKSETTEGTEYSIQHHGSYVCGCEDFQFSKAPVVSSGQRFCCHILAAVAQAKLGRISIDKETF